MVFCFMLQAILFRNNISCVAFKMNEIEEDLSLIEDICRFIHSWEHIQICVTI